MQSLTPSLMAAPSLVGAWLATAGVHGAAGGGEGCVQEVAQAPVQFLTPSLVAALLLLGCFACGLQARMVQLEEGRGVFKLRSRLFSTIYPISEKVGLPYLCALRRGLLLSGPPLQ